MKKDSWLVDATNTLGSSEIRGICRYLDREGYLVGIHKHYRGGRGPSPVAFDDSSEFKEYLASMCRPGDMINLWALPDSEPLFAGKWPNENGEIPESGPY